MLVREAKETVRIARVITPAGCFNSIRRAPGFALDFSTRALFVETKTKQKRKAKTYVFKANLPS